MVKKAFIAVALAVFMIASIQPALLAVEQKAAAKPAPVTAAVKPAPAPAAKPNFSMIAGTVVSIDSVDPNNVNLQIKSDADGAVRSIAVTPWTNITKVTDISELKTGETVRLMTRKAGDKEVAMGIMFGKIKNIPAQPAAKKPMPPVPTGANPKK